MKCLGKRLRNDPSRRERYDCRRALRLTLNDGRSVARHNHTVPYGTGILDAAFPGISCLATIVQSLRDKCRLISPPQKLTMKNQQKIVLGVIVGNRNFFPDSLITQGRQDILGVLNEQNIEAVILDEQATKLGAVETWANAQKCAALFDENRHRIDGILVTLPNFGDEKGIADTIKLSGLTSTNPGAGIPG